MRRPVKPFVTEYRGGVRRQAGQSSKADLLKVDSDAPEPRAGLQGWPQAPEDGYEAALRAADALFSGGREPVPSKPAAADTEGLDANPAEHASGGRVLRVLDEPESPEMARLEAEFAPKKRGRKPGSKNKPKVPALALADSAVAHASIERVTVADELSAFAVSALVSEEADLPPVPVAMMRSALTVTPVARVAIGPAAPRGERYAWVRTRLKPGEQWKRRLPKVAW